MGPPNGGIPKGILPLITGSKTGSKHLHAIHEPVDGHDRRLSCHEDRQCVKTKSSELVNPQTPLFPKTIRDYDLDPSILNARALLGLMALWSSQGM
eukprot:161317-Amphidinium_carterae.1